MVCARIFNCNLKEKRKLEKWKQPNTLTANVVDRRQQQAKDGGGCWRFIGGVMWDSLCGAGKIRMQLQFLTVSKNLNKTKQIYRKKHSR